MDKSDAERLAKYVQHLGECKKDGIDWDRSVVVDRRLVKTILHECTCGLDNLKRELAREK